MRLRALTPGASLVLMNINQDIDPNFYYTDPLSMKTYPAWMVTAVDELLYKVRHKNLWEISDFCIEMWAKKYPTEHKAYLETMKRYRSNRKNETASTDTKTWRNLVEVPREINYLLNKIASHKIEEYGELKFWRDFAKRYPGFRGGSKF